MVVVIVGRGGIGDSVSMCRWGSVVVMVVILVVVFLWLIISIIVFIINYYREKEELLERMELVGKEGMR